jgi:CheY-like chemotaxis protein
VPPSDALKMVLVVEDDADIRSGVRDLLEDEGYQVRTAANGREALDSLAQASRPCLILLDLMMPVMDGHQFLGKLRLQSEWADIPVVVVSAVVTAFPEVAGFIKKPFDPEVLLSSVKKYCDCG